MGEKFDECITKLASKCEKLQDFDGAIDYYKIINSEDDIIRFSARHIKEIYIQENKKGFVDCLYRRFKMTAEAAVDKFGIDNVSRETQNTFRKSPFDEIELVHVVKPRSLYDDKKKGYSK